MTVPWITGAGFEDLHYCDCSCWACQLHEERRPQDDKPTEPGNYWAWHPEFRIWGMVEIVRIEAWPLRITLGDESWDLADTNCYSKWIGPIPVPPDPGDE